MKKNNVPWLEGFLARLTYFFPLKELLKISGNTKSPLNPLISYQLSTKVLLTNIIESNILKYIKRSFRQKRQDLDRAGKVKEKGIPRLPISPACRGSHLKGYSDGKGIFFFFYKKANFSWRNKTRLCARGGESLAVSVTHTCWAHTLPAITTREDPVVHSHGN